MGNQAVTMETQQNDVGNPVLDWHRIQESLYSLHAGYPVMD